MTAEELLQKYADGERNFSHADLRGADLSGANLRGADLRYAVCLSPDGRADPREMQG